jgi:hypothetical protein
MFPNKPFVSQVGGFGLSDVSGQTHTAPELGSLEFYGRKDSRVCSETLPRSKNESALTQIQSSESLECNYGLFNSMTYELISISRPSENSKTSQLATLMFDFPDLEIVQRLPQLQKSACG